MIQFEAQGQMFDGYLSVPASGSGPGVIVIQEWWGLVDHIKDVADRFAREGFVALAPDMYQGRVAEEPDEAGKMMMALRIDTVERQLAGAVDALASHPACETETVGVIGFCMGGQLALLAATVNPKVGACADFYGVHPNVKPRFENLRGPVLGIFALRDDMTSPEVVAQLDETLNRLGKPHEFHSYDADHAFFNDQRPSVYNAEAAADAWKRTVEFFEKNLI